MPTEDIVPSEALPPANPLTDHTTLAFAPLTKAL
jgi:hypothetical protein